MTFSGVHPRNSERFIPKGRRKVLYKSLRQHLGEVFRKLAEQKESRIEEGHLQSDHVHMMISIPPLDGRASGGNCEPKALAWASSGFNG